MRLVRTGNWREGNRGRGMGRRTGGNIRWHYIHLDPDPRDYFYEPWSCRIRHKDTNILNNLFSSMASVTHSDHKNTKFEE